MAMNTNETVKKCNVCGKWKTTAYEPDYSILNDSCFRYQKAIFVCEECEEKYERGEIDGECKEMRQMRKAVRGVQYRE